MAQRLIDANAFKKENERLLHCDFPYLSEATLEELIDEAPTIDAEPHWIPCSDRLPEDDTEVVVSCTDDSGDSEFSYTTTGWHFKGMWVVGNERSYFVRAWMPLPKPYEVEE